MTQNTKKYTREKHLKFETVCEIINNVLKMSDRTNMPTIKLVTSQV